ncbi:MAG: T9SS type A sorting domain-containing protein [Bacteroidota bacterium]
MKVQLQPVTGFFRILALFPIFLASLIPLTAQVYTGSITFTDQLQVDTFPSYTRINGNVEFSGPGILNVDSMILLEHIDGGLFFNDTYMLENIDGLANLDSIEGTFNMFKQPNSGSPTNTTLSHVDGLSNLTYVGQSFAISGYDALLNVDGLISLTSVGNFFTLKGQSLQQIDGLVNLDSVGYELRIEDCPNLLNINGLSGVQTIGSNLVLEDIFHLTDLSALSNLSYLGRNLTARNNPNLISLAGLAQLDSIGPFPHVSSPTGGLSISIQGNAILPDLSGLDSIKSVGGGISFTSNPLLSNVDALSQLDSIFGTVNFNNNNSLKDLYGLRNVVYYAGSLLLIGNDMLNECCGIYNYIQALDTSVHANAISNSNGPACTGTTVFANGPCLDQTVRILEGYSFYDLDFDCVNDPQDVAIPYEIFRAEPGPYYAASDSNGIYRIQVDTGTYTVSLLTGQPDWESCDTNLMATVLPSDTLIMLNDLGIQRDSCPDLSLAVGGFWSRRCFAGEVILNFCNWGLNAADQTQLFVRFPQYISFISASIPHTYQADSTIVFDLGTLSPLECGSIKLNTLVSCESVELLGITQCIGAWMSSPDVCPETAPNWSGASLALYESCLDTINRFQVVNEGQNMTDSSAYRIFADDYLIQTGNLILNMGDSLVFEIPSNGQAFRLEVDQALNHPTNMMVSASLEGCVDTLDSLTSAGALLSYPPPIPNPNPTYTSTCSEIIGSYDPNDKQVFPRGLTEMGLTKPGTRFDYLIRFQNTGTDTAFTVEIIDTLSNELDLAGFELGAASHPFSFEVSGSERPILRFLFSDIRLPDSNVNEPASHGFVQFSIDHRADAALGTLIENVADIYFDFNPPIRTNTVSNILSDFQQEALGSVAGITQTYHPTVTDAISRPVNEYFRIYPNPAADVIYISLKQSNQQQVQVVCIDIHGRQVLENRIDIQASGSSGQQDISSLTPGVYVLRLSAGDRSGSFRIVVTD